MEHGGHGRILVYDRIAKSTTILFDELNFANVDVDDKGRFIYIAETWSYRIIKYWLQGDRKGQREIPVKNL